MQCKRKEGDQFEICVSRNRNPTGHTQEFFGFDGGPYPTPQEGLAAKRASERVKKKNSPQEPIRKGELFRRSVRLFRRRKNKKAELRCWKGQSKALTFK